MTRHSRWRSQRFENRSIFSTPISNAISTRMVDREQRGHRIGHAASETGRVSNEAIRVPDIERFRGDRLRARSRRPRSPCVTKLDQPRCRLPLEQTRPGFLAHNLDPVARRIPSHRRQPLDLETVALDLRDEFRAGAEQLLHVSEPAALDRTVALWEADDVIDDECDLTRYAFSALNSTTTSCGPVASGR